MAGIWFSSDANITDRNLAKFITLLPASNMTPLGGKAAFICHAIQFVTAGFSCMLIKIRVVLLSGPRGEEGPPFIGASRSLSEKILKVHFSVIYAVILWACGPSWTFWTFVMFMISKVLEFIHSLILNYLTYFENVSLYNEAMKSACIYSYCFDKLANFFSLSNFTQTLISYGCQV